MDGHSSRSGEHNYLVVSSLAPARPALPAWCYPANLVTELRLALVPVVVVAVARRHFGWAFLLFCAAAASDGVDGWLARRFQQRSVLGMYLDPVADKLLVAALFIALSIVGELPWALTILVFTRDVCILVSALVLLCATGFRDFRPTWWGKASTVAELATVGVALLSAWTGNAVVRGIEVAGWVVVSALAIVSGIHYAFASARRYHAAAGSGSQQ